MNYLKADIGNTANWDEVWSSYLVAREFRPGLFTPLDGLVIPITLSSPLIAVGCYCPTEVIKPTWVYAGALQAVVDLNLFGNSTLSRSVFATYSALINRSRLVVIPRIINDYQLYFRPARWISRMEVGIFAYTGAYSDELINEIRTVQFNEAVQGAELVEIRQLQTEILSKL